LEYLTDAAVITPAQLQSFLSQLPNQTQLHAPLVTQNGTTNGIPPISTGISQVQSPQSPPVNEFANISMNEKRSNYYTPPPASPAPPSYTPAPLCVATALYAYNPSDAGDLGLVANDTVNVTEYVNAEWWKGTNTRTNQVGIFPRNYVKVVEEKGMPSAPNHQATSYGNMPLDVSQTGSNAGPVDPAKPSKGQEMGKKFGKKMGNAAIFGAVSFASLTNKTWTIAYQDLGCYNRLKHCQRYFLGNGLLWFLVSSIWCHGIYEGLMRSCQGMDDRRLFNKVDFSFCSA
jgi:LAS seventeen-binding protein 1/2